MKVTHKCQLLLLKDRRMLELECWCLSEMKLLIDSAPCDFSEDRSGTLEEVTSSEPR